MLKSRTECLKQYGSDYYINLMVDEGKLFRIDKGIYSDKEHVPELAILSFKYPRGIITLDTAFYLYGLTDEIPDICTMATKREATPIVDSRIKQIFMPNNLMNIGKTHIEYKGYDIVIFDKERLLIELIRYKSKLPYNYYKEILGNYRRILPQLNTEKIRNYAEEVPKSNYIIKILRSEVY